MAVSSHSSHHPHEVILAQFSLYVHTGGLKSHSFHVHFLTIFRREIEIVDNTRHFVTDISRLRPTKACLGAGVKFSDATAYANNDNVSLVQATSLSIKRQTLYKE